MDILTQPIPPHSPESMLAAFLVFLHRYGQQEHTLIVTPVEQGQLVVLSSHFDPARTFRQVCQQIALDIKNAERIQAGDFGNTPESVLSFQVFCHVWTPPEPAFLNPEQFQRLGLRLAFQCDGATATWYFNEKYYPRAEAGQITRVFSTFLEHLTAAPDIPCSRIPFLPPQESERLLVELNRTETDFPSDSTVHHLFETWASQSPESVAVVFGNESITYGALDKRADRIAWTLRQRGVRPGIIVGLFLERGIELVIAQLGVLKAGGAFAALDPQFPKDALHRIFETVQIPFIVTRSENLSSLPGVKAATMVLDGQTLLAHQPEKRLEPSARPDDPVFLLFTSGSTGLPKAVLHTHRNIVARFFNIREVGKLQACAVFAQASPISSIDSVDEILVPLSFGAQTVIIPYEIVTEPRQLVDTLAARGVTHILLVPSLLRVILSADAEVGSKLAALKTWMVGGEALSGALARLFYEKMPRSVLINFYGLTEGDATAYIVPGDGEYPANMPVGRPGQNTKVYLLDEYLNPVPAGMVGEIYLSGQGLFREYLNRLELNAERWIENPFCQHPAYRRIFRSGDLGRYLPGGEIEYVGRRDRMVKVRGFRVELGEVEAVLLRHPAVREVVVSARAVKTNGSGFAPQQRLIAHVVLHPGKEATPFDLLSYARDNLADFAVPSTIIPLEKFPLLPSGKVDMKNLPDPWEGERGADMAFVAPRNPVEAQLASLWAELLQRHPVGIDDNFFDIGGDSLAAIDLMLRIEKKFQKHLPISALMQAPTVAALAEMLTKEQPQKWSSLVPIRPGGPRPPLFCVHADGGVLFYYAFARYMTREVPIYGLQARGLLGTHDAPLSSVEAMAEHYVNEIRTIQAVGPYHLCAFSAGGLVIYEMARQLRALGEEVAFVGLLDAYGPNYPVLLPGRAMIYYKLSVHLNTLRLHGFWGQVGYLMRRARKRLGIVFTNMSGSILTALRLPLPHLVRYNYIARIIDQASGNYYTGQAYDGDIVLFKASTQPVGIEPDPYLGWGSMVKGQLKIIDVPGTHNSIMKEPHLLELVHALEAHLESITTK